MELTTAIMIEDHHYWRWCCKTNCHLHLSTDQYSIIRMVTHSYTLQMPQPSESIMPHHIRHTLHTQKTVQIHTALPTHPPLRILVMSGALLNVLLHYITLHITIIFLFLSKFCRFAFFVDQVSVSYVNKLWTQAIKFFPFVRYDSPRAVRMEDISLNFAEALALAASSAPSAAPIV